MSTSAAWIKKGFTKWIGACALALLVCSGWNAPASAQEPAEPTSQFAHCSDGFVPEDERSGNGDSDGDTDPDWNDPFPYLVWALDVDEDCVHQQDDHFPDDPTEWRDSDGDGIGDNADPDTPRPTPAPTTDSELDTDRDGVIDILDAFPNDPVETTDSDRDGIGNEADADDDNDGVRDEADAFPLDPLLTVTDAQMNEYLDELRSDGTISTATEFEPLNSPGIRPFGGGSSTANNTQWVRLLILVPLLLLRFARFTRR